MWHKIRGKKMQQIKNYLSRIQTHLHSVLLIMDESQEFQKFLQDELGVEEVLYNCDVSQKNLDAVIIGKGCQNRYREAGIVDTKYFIAALSTKEEYFTLWEEVRGYSDFVYIVRDKEYNPKDRDANDCEILEWEKGDSGIELSVVLPVYNVEKYLPRCIETLTAWKASYVEFLFVNDGSTDYSAQVIESYAEKDSRIHLLNKENGGCASARNYGIEHARGRYIGFVDSDDFVDERMFQKLLSRAIMGNYELSYCGYCEYYEDTGDLEPILNDCLGEPYVSGTYRQDKVQKLAINTRVAIWRCIYKKSLLERSHLRFHEDLKRFDDLPFRVECIFSAQSAVCVPEYLYFYRLGRRGQDVSCTDERLWVHFRIFEYLDDFVEQMRDRRLLDYLQIIKVNTHGYALGRIEKRYYKRYKKEAAAQLDKYAGTIRTLCLLIVYGGKSHIGWYLRR